jgi:hypothetical protein
MKATRLASFRTFWLSVGLLSGWTAAYIYSGKMMAETLLLLKTIELHRSDVESFEAYKRQDPEVAIWALDRHFRILGELEADGYPSGELQRQSFVTNARLAKLWSSMGVAQKEAHHVNESLTVAEELGPPFAEVTSTVELFKVLEKYDSAREE